MSYRTVLLLAILVSLAILIAEKNLIDKLSEAGVYFAACAGSLAALGVGSGTSKLTGNRLAVGGSAGAGFLTLFLVTLLKWKEFIGASVC